MEGFFRNLLVCFSLIILSGCSFLKGLNNLVAPSPAEQARQEPDEPELRRVELISFKQGFPRTEVDSVEIMTSRPDQKYVEIGLLTVQSQNANNGGFITGGHVESYEELTALLKKKAASIGANAIMNFQTRQVAVSMNESTRKIRSKNEVTGTAIKYLNK